MINGYEYLYQEQNGKKPKYELHVAKDQEYFAHEIDGSGKTTHLGVTACEAITNLLESNIGKDFYKQMLKMVTSYNEFYTKIVQYQQDKAKLDEFKTRLSVSKNDLAKANDDKKKIEKAIKMLMDSDVKDKTSKLKRLNKDLSIKEKEVSALKTSTDLTSKLLAKAEKKLNKNYEELKALKQKLEKMANAVDVKKLEEVKRKFASPEFIKQIEQEFVDTMLLPGDEKNEESTRFAAQTWLKVFNTELKYLSSMKSVLQNILSNVGSQLSEYPQDIALNNDVEAQYKIVNGMKYLSTDIIENSKGRFDARHYCEFYNEAIRLIKESNYGKNPSIEVANLPEVALKNYGFKTKNKKYANEDLDSAVEIFRGAERIIEGQAILTGEVDLDKSV